MPSIQSVSFPFHSKSMSESHGHLDSKQLTQSLRLLNHSQISMNSETSRLQQEANPLFTLRVVNPDLQDEAIDDNEEDEQSYYKPTLNSVLCTPELKQAELPQSPLQQHKPSMTTTSVTRKVSKTLVESPPPQKSFEYQRDKDLELLPPLERLPPLLTTIHESHLLSPASSTPTQATAVTTDESQVHTPPQLPQHHPDFLSSALLGKGEPSVAQQSVNASIIITSTLDGLVESPEELDRELDRDSTAESDNDRSLLRQSIDTEHSSRRHLSLTPSNTTELLLQQQQQQQSSSRYAKASYSLTNHPDAIKLYRSMAHKTNDRAVQLTYAKYLLDVARLYRDDPERPQQQRPAAASSRPSLSFLVKRPRRESLTSQASHSRRSSIDTHFSLNTALFSPSPSQQQQHRPSDEDDTRRKKRKMLEDEGVRWIKRLAKEQVGEAAYLLASWYDRGLYGFRKNLSRALRFYEIAAQQKVPEAMFAVGQYHEREQDYMTSFQLYEEAASLGLVEALYKIAMINLNGEFGSRRNVNGAIQLLIKASEKSTGTCPEAPYTLGLLLTNDYPSVDIPNEVIQSYGGTFAATTYLEHAAEMGLGVAQYRLGYIYEQGLYGIRINLAKAVHYYLLAANDNNHSYAMLHLSQLYNQGVKAPPDQLDEQRALFEQDESHWTLSQPRDEDAAFRWCQLAADQNLPDACYLLGWYYEMAIGVPRDFQQAHHYYVKAAKKGNHKLAKERVDLLEGLAKRHQKDERRRSTMLFVQDRKSSTSVVQQRVSAYKNSHSRESQCNIM